MAGQSANDWWAQSESELEAAYILRRAGKQTQAYFHAGQAVEFALKALYLRRDNLIEMPPDRRGARWHDLKVVADAARLSADLDHPRVSRALRANWLTVRDWNSAARYPGSRVSARELNDLFVAVCHEKEGVWRWLQAIFQAS